MASPIRTGAMPRDGNRHPVPVETSFLPQDENATPNVSPIAITSNTAVQLTVPEKAVALSMVSVGADLRYAPSGAMNGAVNNGYDLAAANVRTLVGVAGLSTLQVRRDSTTNLSLYFHFKTLE